MESTAGESDRCTGAEINQGGVPRGPGEQAGRSSVASREELAFHFDRHCPRLLAMIRFRMDPRLRGRIDPADVLQEAWLDIDRRFPEYRDDPQMPLYLWIRFLTLQKLVQLYRRHLGAGCRDAGREVRLHAGPAATSVSIAAGLMGSFTSPSRGAARAELKERLTALLDEMDEVDREVLTLRHFEELTNNETAEVLGLSKAAASNRYVRALGRLHAALGDALDLVEEPA